MKKICIAALIVLSLTACGNRASGKKAGNEPIPNEEPVQTAAAETKAAASGEAFTFDELWKIFSVFGQYIAPEMIDTQAKKDAKKDMMEEMFNSSLYKNMLTVGEYDENGCGTDFTMVCYRYKADDHILALLLETVGCDVSTQSVRAYEYDPAQNSAHEIQIPVEFSKADFDDYLRLYRIKDAARFARLKGNEYVRYMPTENGVNVYMDVETGYDEDWWKVDPRVAFLWNGSYFDKAPQQRYNVLEENRFAGMNIGDPLPGADFRDPAGVYTLQKTSEGTTVLKNGNPVLIVRGQGSIGAFQVLSPEYSAELGVHVGTRFADNEFLSSPDVEFDNVWCYPDGTVTFSVSWQKGILYEIDADKLVSPKVSRSDMGTSGMKIDEKPVFSKDAVIKSIFLVGSND